MDKSQVCFRLYDFSLFSPILLWSSKRQDPFSYPFFGTNVAKIISYVSLQSFSFALSICTLFNVFLKQFSWSGFLSPWLKKKEQKRENCSFRYLNSVGDVYFGHSFLQQRLFGQALTFGGRQALQIAGLFLFLIISFSRFQYFSLHFGSLKLCFTNLVLEIQDNLSLIFLSSLEISNLIYFTHFRLSPIIMGHISKFKPRFVQYAKI